MAAAFARDGQLIIAPALRAGCTVLYFEDLHDGMTIDRRLRLVDPFREL